MSDAELADAIAGRAMTADVSIAKPEVQGGNRDVSVAVGWWTEFVGYPHDDVAIAASVALPQYFALQWNRNGWHPHEQCGERVTTLFHAADNPFAVCRIESTKSVVVGRSPTNALKKMIIDRRGGVLGRTELRNAHGFVVEIEPTVLVGPKPI